MNYRTDFYYRYLPKLFICLLAKIRFRIEETLNLIAFAMKFDVNLIFVRKLTDTCIHYLFRGTVRKSTWSKQAQAFYIS